MDVQSFETSHDGSSGCHHGNGHMGPMVTYGVACRDIRPILSSLQNVALLTTRSYNDQTRDSREPLNGILVWGIQMWDRYAQHCISS